MYMFTAINHLFITNSKRPTKINAENNGPYNISRGEMASECKLYQFIIVILESCGCMTVPPISKLFKSCGN